MVNNLIGKRFGRLIVIKRVNNDKWKKSQWLCLCDCKRKKIITGNSLNQQLTKSCGCLRREITIKRSTKHGHNNRNKISKTYHIWHQMKQRCMNPNNLDYSNYGGRGIKICKRWIKFENFLKDMSEVPEGYQIDRINNNNGYYKNNCRWATPKQQARNRNNNNLKTLNGKTQCLAAWAEECNISFNTLRARLYRYGWSIEKALTTKVRRNKEMENGN